MAKDFTDGVLWRMSGDKILMRPDISQAPVLNTNETDVVYPWHRENNPMCGE